MKNYKRYRAGKLVKKTRPKVRAMKIKKKKQKNKKHGQIQEFVERLNRI